MNLSVIICTHNPRSDYLNRTLDSLKRQTLPRSEWEFLIIDNASSSDLSNDVDLSWHPKARVIREDEVGLTSARIRGIQEAVGDLLLFVDDDNILDPAYLELSVKIGEKMPCLGCFGAGILKPEFEVPPAPELLDFTGMLALREVQKVTWSNDPDDRSVPWGAGMVVRKEVALQHHENMKSSKLSGILDRKGNELNSCGDDEFSWTACGMGLGKGIFPELMITHLIGRQRLEKAYLIRLAEGHTYSRALLRWIHMGYIPETGVAPSGRGVVRSLVAGKISRFFSEGTRWWHRRGQSAIRREFEDAWKRGRVRAEKFLRNLKAEEGKAK